MPVVCDEAEFEGQASVVGAVVDGDVAVHVVEGCAGEGFADA